MFTTLNWEALRVNDAVQEMLKNKARIDTYPDNELTTRIKALIYTQVDAYAPLETGYLIGEVTIHDIHAYISEPYCTILDCDVAMLGSHRGLVFISRNQKVMLYRTRHEESDTDTLLIVAVEDEAHFAKYYLNPHMVDLAAMPTPETSIH